MLRRSRPALGILSVLKEELRKATELLSHDLSSYGKFLTGDDMSEKEKKIREKHQELANKDAAAAAEIRSKMTWAEKIAAAKDELKNATRKNAAVVALVQHCARAHMAEIAVEQDIDVQNINIITEGIKNEKGEEVDEKVIGYIDAPAATQEEVFAYATKLEKACPAARTHGDIEWRHKSTNTVVKPSSKSLRIDDDDDDDFVFAAGSPFSSFAGSKKNNYKNRHDDFDGEAEGKGDEKKSNLSDTDDDQKNTGVSFKPTNKTRNSHSDFVRTAMDLEEALEKSAKDKTTRLIMQEEEKAREEVPEIKSTSSTAAATSGFVSMKSMGLMNNNNKTSTSSDNPIPPGFQSLKQTSPPSMTDEGELGDKKNAMNEEEDVDYKHENEVDGKDGGWFFANKTSTNNMERRSNFDMNEK